MRPNYTHAICWPQASSNKRNNQRLYKDSKNKQYEINLKLQLQWKYTYPRGYTFPVIGKTAVEPKRWAAVDWVDFFLDVGWLASEKQPWKVANINRTNKPITLFPFSSIFFAFSESINQSFWFRFSVQRTKRGWRFFFSN